MPGRDEGLEGADLTPPDGELPIGEMVEPIRPVIDRALDRLAAWYHALAGWLPLAVAITASPGLLLWPLLVGETGHLFDNDFPLRVRQWAGAFVAGSMLLVAVPYVVAAWRAEDDRVDALRRMNERLLILLVLPVLPWMLHAGVEKSRPWFVITFAAGMAAIAGAWAYRQQPTAGVRALPAWLPAALAGVGTVAWAVQMSVLAIGQHHGFETAIYDLGIYDSIFWHSIHGEPLASDFVRGGNHITAHFDPLLVLLSPLYLIYPQAELILVLQVVWVAAGVIPVWMLARGRLGPWHALGFVAIYLLLPSVHGRTLYHFHSLTLAGPLLLWSMAALELGKLRQFWVALALLLLTREDMPLIALLIGAYAIVGKGHKRLGAATIAISAVYLAFVKLVVMQKSGLLTTNSSDAYGYAYYYEDLIPHRQLGATGLLVSLATNPMFALQHILAEPKLQFFALVFLPVIFLPLVAARGRMLLLYGFAFIFLASRSAVYSVAFQYATVLDPFVLGLAIVGLADLKEAKLPALRRLDPLRARPALLVAMLVSTAVLSFKFGAFVPNQAFRAGFHRLVTEPSEAKKEGYAWLQQVIERIGPDASVSASSALGPHVSNRGDAYPWPTVRNADYILVQKRELRGKNGPKLRKLESEGKYVRVDEQSLFLLLERADRVQQTEKAEKAAPTPAPEAGEGAGSPGTLRRLPAGQHPAMLHHKVPRDRLVVPGQLQVDSDEP